MIKSYQTISNHVLHDAWMPRTLQHITGTAELQLLTTDFEGFSDSQLFCTSQRTSSTSTSIAAIPVPPLVRLRKHCDSPIDLSINAGSRMFQVVRVRLGEAYALRSSKTRSSESKFWNHLFFVVNLADDTTVARTMTRTYQEHRNTLISCFSLSSLVPEISDSASPETICCQLNGEICTSRSAAR